jgi:hypothetical protein
VRAHLDPDEEIAGGSTTGAHRALAFDADAGTVADPRGHLDLYLARAGVARQLDGPGRATVGLLEADLGLTFDVLAAEWRRRAPAATTEHAAEKIA